MLETNITVSESDTNYELYEAVAEANPLRYRGYYYDNETGFYYLQTRYYDPAICRFINADTFATTDIDGLLSANMFAYCENNPVMSVDYNGECIDTFWDVISLCSSAAEVIANPADPWAWASLAGDVVDVVVPGVSGVGEVVSAASDLKKASKAAKKLASGADNIADGAKATKCGWKVGDDITNLTRAGNMPSWTTVRQRFWKNEAYYHPNKYTESLDLMKKGRAPIGLDGYPMELHHPNGRNGQDFFNFIPLTRTEHMVIHYGAR